MASTRSRRGVRTRSPNPSDIEDPGSDSDYSPGSLIIDMGGGADESLSSAPSPVIQPLPTTLPVPNKGRRSLARRQYNTESNRMVFNGVRLCGQIDVVQTGHSKPMDRLYLYSYGWGDFFLDIISRRTNSFIPVKNIYEKVIPGLKRNVLSARISKLQVKSEALSEPYITSMKKLGLVVTGASHFVGIVDFIKICQYFHVQSPNNLSKFYVINSEVDPQSVLQSFSNDPPINNDNIFQQQQQQESSNDSLLVSHGQSNTSSGSEIMSLLSTNTGLVGQGEGGSGVVAGEMRPSSRGSGIGGEMNSTSSPYEKVDIRRLSGLAGGVSVSVVVRSGVAYLLKVELPAILPPHSRDVLETIRRTYGITVQHANKSEISLLKNKGVVGGKAGRCALFSASDVCNMFRHWKTAPPQPITELAEGKLPSEKLDNTSELPLPPYSLPNYTFPLEDTPLQPFPSLSDIRPSIPHSTTHTPSQSHTINPLNLSPYTSSQQQHPPPTNHQTPNPHSLIAPRLSHPPTVTSTQFPISSLSPDQFQQPIQILNSLNTSAITPSLPPPHTGPSHFVTPSLPPFSTHSHTPYTTNVPQSHLSQSDFNDRGMSLPISTNYTLAGLDNPNSYSDGFGKPHVVSGIDYSSVIKVEGSGSKRRSSSSGPPLNDQDLEYVSMVWGDREVTLLCPPGGTEPFLAIPELVDKIFHNRTYVSAQRRSELGITTLPATSLQMHILRAKGSLDTFTGNAKLVSLSGAVKLAAVSNIQIPGTVIQMIRKYCKEPLESIITPAGFAPATHAPSSQPTQSFFSPAHSSQHSHHHSSQGAHSESPSQDSESSSYSTTAGVTGVAGVGGKTVPQSPKKRALPSKQVVKSSNDESAASVSPLEGVPHHHDLIDPGPNFTNTGDGTYCFVKWGGERLVLLIGSQRVHYMGLYQVFQTLFKQYATRMNFKMRMRKLEIKSIRAASSVRQALINLEALPHSSPVCGLVRVSEVERLARSYGVVPPQVLYDVFLLKHSDQKQLPNYTRSGAGANAGVKGVVQKVSDNSARSSSSTNLFQSDQGFRESWGNNPLMMEQAAIMASSALPFGRGSMQFGIAQSSDSITSSLPPTTHMHSTVITTATSDKNALMVSVPRQSLTSRFRLVSRPVAPPGIMAGFHSSSRSYCTPVLHSLAKKISQKSRKLGKGKTSGVGAVRSCLKCKFINPASKKRCTRCYEFMVGRNCPECGTLNHNRTRECFRCNATIVYDGNSSPPDGPETEGFRRAPSEGGSISPESPLSPHFSPPPIRNAALKSMFPQDSGKTEDSGVVTKTMFSGNLASSRKCIECGQLNSKMAKKCLQCKSPLQGRPCPQCNRPNHSHSTECYKCGQSLPSTATKWVYVGSNSNKIYRSHEGSNSTRLTAGLKNRASVICLRCDRLRNSGQFTCGRCGDMYWTKPIVTMGTSAGPSEHNNGDTGHGTQSGGHSKKRKTGLEPNWNIPEEPDPEDLVAFASNLLCLDIGDGLLSLVNEAESKARETVHQAEEELEVLEEEYQACAHRREEKENILNDARAELEAMIAEVEQHTKRLSQLKQKEESAKDMSISHPDNISQLKDRVECALKVFTLQLATSSQVETNSETDVDVKKSTEPVTEEKEETMDTNTTS